MTLFKKILFPTNFSENANRALSHALRMGNPEGSELIVQHVVSDYFERHPQWATLFDVHELQKKMDFHAQHRMETAISKEIQDKIKIRHVISQGRAEDEIIAIAQKEMVDVIVMGPTRGAVTGKVIRRATRPVLSVPSQEGAVREITAVKRMIVATDFSEYSKKVVRYGFELKERMGCSMYLVHVIETPSWLGSVLQQSPRVSEKMREWAENQLKSITPDELISDANLQRVVEEGSPANRIAALVEENEADLVVLGAHGYGPMREYLVGTTTDKVLARVGCPVLTVRL